MAAPQLPALFLSHSGQQKGFVWSLYRQLLHVNHSPFFDQDSRPDFLPKGSPFPSRILDACRACKLGIVVLSHDYIESMWPMLELQQLLFHNPSSPHNLFPIFYELEPADLCKPENLMRWKSVWDRKAPVWHERNRDQHMATPTTFQALTLDIDSWPRALDMLHYQNGQIRPGNKDDHTFIQAIVSNICKSYPPPESFLMGDQFKGAEHIQQEIHKMFQQQQQRQQMDQGISDACRRMPVSVGLYGVGGSGKTTVCKFMLTFYNKEHSGRCCFLQFPSKGEDESQQLVQSMKDFLSKHGNLAEGTLGTINCVEQAMPRIQEFLRRYKVFFILDNVWDSTLLAAQQIVTMDYMPGSKLLVTARSEVLLRTLSSYRRLGGPSPMQIVHVPSIFEEEAIEALKAYSLTSLQYFGNVEDLRGLARCCFFGEQCHPLLLKAVGVKLRHLGGRIRSTQDLTRLCSRLKAHAKQYGEEIEDTVVNVLKTSYDALCLKLQKTFLNLGTCVPKQRYLHCDYKSLLGSSEWLSMISTDRDSQTTDDIRDQLIELEYHGLLQIYKGDVVIHDLQMMLIQNIVRKRDGDPACFFFEGNVEPLSGSEWSRLKYIHGFAEEGSSALTYFSSDQRETSADVSSIEVLHLQERGCYLELRGLERRLRFSVQHMRFLQHLVLDGVWLEEIRGWHGTPNLVSVVLKPRARTLDIESMACLHRLERLDIRIRGTISHDYLGLPPNLQELCISDISVAMGALSALSSLQQLTVNDDNRICEFSVSKWINLRKLTLCRCGALQTIKGSVHGFSTALEELCLRDCRNLESIPDLKHVGNLSRLELKGCKALKDVKVGDAALKSLEHLSLEYGRCHLVSTPSCLPLHVSAFTNLRSLYAHYGKGWGSTESEVVDVGSRHLPVSLECLELVRLGGAEKEMVGLSTLVNLQCLSIVGWPSLTSITGLGSLTNLTCLNIVGCFKSLREVGHWEAPFSTYKLEAVDIISCPRLEMLSTMRHLTSLTTFFIDGSPKLQVDMLPKGAHGYLNGKRIQ